MNDKHPLGQLIKTVQEARGWSERQLEEKAAGRPGLGKSNISKIKNHPLVSIKGVVIKGLAELLGVPESKVAAAALESMGVNLSTEAAATLEDSVRNEIDLSDKDRRILLAVLNEMKREVVEHVRSAPITRAGESPAAGTSEDYDLAAYSVGREATGRRLRREQDEAAEESQAAPEQ